MYGAGAIGGVVAARLAQNGVATSVVARGAHLAAIREQGLHFHTPEGATVVRLPATDDPATLGPQDVVICAVKAHQLAAIARPLTRLLHDKTAVVYALNGLPWWYFYRAGGEFDGRRLERLDPGGALWDTVGIERTIGCVINMPCTVTAPGEVHFDGGPNRLALGEPSGEKTDRLDAIAETLAACGIDIETHRPIREEVWTKASRLMATSPIALLTASETAAVVSDPTLRALTRLGWEEAIAIAAAFGVSVDVNIEAALDRMTGLVGHRASIVQDLDAGRPIEIDAQIVAPLELAHEAAVPVPTLDMLAALTLARVRAAGLYSG